MQKAVLGRSQGHGLDTLVASHMYSVYREGLLFLLQSDCVVPPGADTV